MPARSKTTMRVDLIARKLKKRDGAMPATKLPFNFYSYASPANLIRVVALKHGLTYYSIVGASRVAKVVSARREAVRLVKTHCVTMTPHAIGRLFHRDRTSILNLLGTLRRSRQASPKSDVGELGELLETANLGVFMKDRQSDGEAVV